MSPACHLALRIVAQSADLQLAEDYLEQVYPAAAQVQEVSEVPDPYHPLEQQDFQVASVATTELDLPTSDYMACLEVPDTEATLACLEASAPAPLVEVETMVSALALAELDSPASPREAHHQTTVSDQTTEAPAWEADLDPLALAREQASVAAALPGQVRREAFQADSLPFPLAASKVLDPMVSAETTVVTVDILITATVTMVLVWAAATDGADTADSRVFSMLHTAAMASVSTPSAVDMEVFTALASKVLLPALDLALSYIWALEVQVELAVLAERARGQADQAPAPVAVLHRAHRKIYVN